MYVYIIYCESPQLASLTDGETGRGKERERERERGGREEREGGRER